LARWLIATAKNGISSGAGSGSSRPMPAA
jgi:hypothetical protein